MSAITMIDASKMPETFAFQEETDFESGERIPGRFIVHRESCEKLMQRGCRIETAPDASSAIEEHEATLKAHGYDLATTTHTIAPCAVAACRDFLNLNN